MYYFEHAELVGYSTDQKFYGYKALRLPWNSDVLESIFYYGTWYDDKMQGVVVTDVRYANGFLMQLPANEQAGVMYGESGIYVLETLEQLDEYLGSEGLHYSMQRVKLECSGNILHFANPNGMMVQYAKVIERVESQRAPRVSSYALTSNI